MRFTFLFFFQCLSAVVFAAPFPSRFGGRVSARGMGLSHNLIQRSPPTGKRPPPSLELTFKLYNDAHPSKVTLKIEFLHELSRGAFKYTIVTRGSYRNHFVYAVWESEVTEDPHRDIPVSGGVFEDGVQYFIVAPRAAVYAYNMA